MAGRKPDPKRAVTVNVSMRLDPKMKYLIDLLARDQKRTITGVIEWALVKAASQELVIGDGYGDSETFAQAIDDLWSTDEAIRLVKLAIYRQSLLDYDEMRIWETIRASSNFWKIIVSSIPAHSIQYEHIYIYLLQKHWDSLVEHVRIHRNARSIVPYELPQEDCRPVPSRPIAPEDDDFEIPY